MPSTPRSSFILLASVWLRRSNAKVSEQIAGFDWLTVVVFSIQWNACEQLFGPRSQTEIIVAQELLDEAAALAANQTLVGQASLDVAHVLAIAQLFRAEFCTLAAKVPGVAPTAEAFICPVAVTRPTVMPAVMRFSFASTHR
ncbi:MAG: hypothetical protein B7Z73_02150 [Planctomycetia bacterium 21-64-5]|nr:MAG: hypothetical protein B7Z73_02150 [Planctomycetia bacterium 21-64-5]